MALLAVTLARLRALPMPVRLGAAGAIVAALILATFVAFAGRHVRVPLFATALHPEQLTAVQDQLAAWNVPLTPLADNVVVDASRRSGLLLRLSLAGVPHAHVESSGEALANVGVLTPQAVIDAQARSGLAGDIELALRSVDGVDDACVIVAPAQSAEFSDQRARPATASVRLQLHPGAVFSRGAIDGIRQFVAASVAGLDPASVTILDDRGFALGENGGSDDARTLEAALQSALDAAFGAGVAIVRVSAEYTHAVSERRDTRHAATGDPIQRSAQSETFSGSGKSYSKSTERDDRGEETHESVVRDDAGAIGRISTAVFVDELRGADLAKIRDLAAATVGFDPRRGDRLSVEAVAFHRTLQPKRDALWMLYGAIVPLLPVLAAIGAIALAARTALPAVAGAFASMLERDAITRTSRAVAGYAPASVRSALSGEPPHAAAAIICALPAATAAAVLELYPPHEREAIVRRMQRAHSSVVPTVEEVLGRHA